MGWWRTRVVPRLIDRALRGEDADAYRATVCAGTAGRVVELGFGSGRSLPFYPDAVTEVLAVEPSGLALELAEARVAAFGRPVTPLAPDAATLPLPDASIDHVVSTWTLCTIPDAAGALSEARRVLRPGGSLHLVEHGLAPEESVRRQQRRLQPWWGRLAGGCHLDRDIAAMLRTAGFDTTALSSGYHADVKASRPFGYYTHGVAAPEK